MIDVVSVFGHRPVFCVNENYRIPVAITSIIKQSSKAVINQCHETDFFVILRIVNRQQTTVNSPWVLKFNAPIIQYVNCQINRMSE